MLIINTDGACKGNPGKMSVGLLIKDEKNNIITKYYKTIGYGTNNIAEYSAVIKALELANLYISENEEILIKSDSELLIKQLNGIYKVKNNNLIPLYNKIKILEKNFYKVIYKHVKRDENKEADYLANLAFKTYKN